MHRFTQPALTLALIAMLMHLGACKEAGEELAEHFEAMAAITDAHAGLEDESARDCGAMGEALEVYMEEQREALESLMAEQGEAESSQTGRIYAASQRIQAGVQACSGDERVQAFQQALSKMVIASVK